VGEGQCCNKNLFGDPDGPDTLIYLKTAYAFVEDRCIVGYSFLFWYIAAGVDRMLKMIVLS